MNSRLGMILMFEGDIRRVTASIKNVTSFSTLTAELKNGDTDVTSLYINVAPSSRGNVIISDLIGGKASIPQGRYRYFVHGTYGGKKRTWYWDVAVLPKDLSLIQNIDISLEDYDPLVEEVVAYEGDNFMKSMIVPDMDFSAVTAKFCLLSQDVTGVYCASAPAYVNDTLTTHDIGGNASVPSGDYGYFITGTYSNSECKSTWYYRVKVLPKQGILS